MHIKFSFLEFQTTEGSVTCNGLPIAQVNIAGQDRDTHLGVKMIETSESKSLTYVSHQERENELVILQKNERIAVETVFTKYTDTNAVRVYTTVTNLSTEDLTLEQVGTFAMGLPYSRDAIDDIDLYRFCQNHHGECQPHRQSLRQGGLSTLTGCGQARVAQANIGSWSTKEALPQGILHHRDSFLMFQIECNHSWYFEISDFGKNELYLYLGGANSAFGSWCKTLAPQESYTTKAAALCCAETLNGIIEEMTTYRRHIAGHCAADETLPAIFNEYMHLSWDSPDEEAVKRYAPIVQKTGVTYYVIDCGWHDDVEGWVYPYVGAWKESRTRFPNGLAATTAYIRSLGMLPGLWIEPEVVGKLCQEMIDYYGDECFLHRHGKKICVMGRLFLDFRKKKVTDYLTQTIRRMVEEYGAAYIKLDYNEDLGIGCDDDADDYGEGLEQCAAAYLRWIDTVRALFPTVLFETCSSGGLRMDYETLSHFSIISTSDQVDYRKYPYIAANLLAGVLPEQAAVWSYPVGSPTVPEGKTLAEVVNDCVSDEQVIQNMVNSFLGRLHLASHLELLSEERLALIKEGVAYYSSLAEMKKTAVPVFPLGFASETDTTLAAGLTDGHTLYLAVWNLGEETEVTIPLPMSYKKAVCAYPAHRPLPCELTENGLRITFTQPAQARFFELSCE